MHVGSPRHHSHPLQEPPRLRYRFASSNSGGENMTDDKSKQGARDRSRVSGSEDYEVEYFAKKHGLTAEKAREIIKQAGGNRAKADEIAGNQKG
jgi:hypothetical protein